MAQKLIDFQKNKEASQMLSRAMQQQVYQKEIIDTVLREDQWLHKFKSDPMKTVAWKSYHQLLESQIEFRNTMVAEEAKIEGKCIPKNNIKGIEMAKYSLMSLDDLEDEDEYQSRYIMCKVICQPMKEMKSGSFEFLVKDNSHKTERVVRVTVENPPPNWGLFSF